LKVETDRYFQKKFSPIFSQLPIFEWPTDIPKFAYRSMYLPIFEQSILLRLNF